MSPITATAWPQTVRFQRPEPRVRGRLAGRSALADEALDWRQASPDALVDHLLGAHHAALREALPALAERTAAMRDAAPAHAEAVEALDALLHRLDFHLRKLEQVVYPLLRRVAAGRPGAGIIERLLAPDALDLDADAAALQAQLGALHRLARHCPDPAAARAARALDDRARRFLRLETDVLLPRARQLARSAGRSPERSLERSLS